MEFNQDIHLDPANENAQVSSGNEALEMPATKSHPSRARTRGKRNRGKRVLCYVGPLLYLAKCVKLKKDSSNRISYFIHYQGWNKNWDEWVPESRILEHNSENLEKFANILWEGKRWGKHRKIRYEGPASKKSKLDGSKILSCIKRRVDNSGMSMENEDVEGSDKETDFRQVIDARLNDQIEGPASKKSKLEHEQSRILSSIKLRVDNSGSRILNLESLRIAESFGIGTENEEADGSNNETDLRQFIKSRKFNNKSSARASPPNTLEEGQAATFYATGSNPEVSNSEDSPAEKLKLEIHSLQVLQENDELKSLINELSKGLMLQESKVNELKTKVDVLSKEKSRLNERNQEFLDGNKALLKSFHQGRLQYHEEKTSKNELQTKVDHLIQENKELKSSVNKFKTKVDCLSKEKSQLNEELISTLKSYNEEKTSKNELQTKVDNLTLENSQLKRINGIISDDLKKQFETQSNQKAYINPDDYVFDHEMVIKKEIKEERAE